MPTPESDGLLSTLQLLRLPFTFTQVKLLTQSHFKKQAAEWGHRLSDDALEELDGLGLLVPFYVCGSEPGRVWTTADGDETREAKFARDGYLDDPGARDIETPDGGDRLYSQWQLLGLRTAMAARRNVRVDPSMHDLARQQATRERQVHVTLAALTNRFFPRIIGRWVEPTGSSFAELRRTSRDLDAATRLEVAGASAQSLRTDAEWLLTLAHNDDPLGGWWQVARHSDHHGWFKLKGIALQTVWYRIGAEVLLRTHEELAHAGTLEPLPSVAAAQWWLPLMDRVGAPDRGLSLDQALTQMAVSPHPQVVLVVEGATEELHVRELLSVLGVNRQVRVVNQGTSGDRPHELARFLAPRVSDVNPDRQSLERNPTALFIAMDPEHAWAPSSLPNTVRSLREHIREEVERQGGVIGDDELDELLHVRTWCDHTYELANFTDHELTDALVAIAPPYATVNEALRAELAEHVAYARDHRCDLKVVFDRAGWDNLKVRLAEELAPVLIRKIDVDNPPPIISLVWDVLAAVERLSHGTIYLKGQS